MVNDDAGHHCETPGRRPPQRPGESEPRPGRRIGEPRRESSRERVRRALKVLREKGERSRGPKGPRPRPLAPLPPDPEARELARELARVVESIRLRAARRMREARRGRFDPRRLFRRSVAQQGVPFELPWRAPRRRPSRVVLLVDVSWSVTRHAATFLWIASEFLEPGRRTRVVAFVDRPVDATLAIARWKRASRGTFAGVLKGLPGLNLDAPSDYGRALHADYVKLSQRIGRTTGGIDSTTFIANVQDTQNSTAWLLLRGKATAEHESDLLEILSDIFSTARLDDKGRFRQIVLEEKASLEARLVPLGNWFVDTRLRAHQNEAGWVAEHVGGISYLFFIRELVNEIEKDWAGVLEKIESVRRLLVSRNTMIANVTWDANNWKRFQPKLSDFLKSMPSSELPEIRWKPQ